VLVQGPAVQLPGQLGAEDWLVQVLHGVRGQLLAIEAQLHHQAEAGGLGEVAPYRRDAVGGGANRKEGVFVVFLLKCYSYFY